NQPLHQITAGVKDIEETISRAGDIVMFIGVLHCIGDKYLPVELANPEWSESSRKSRIGEREAGGRLQRKILIVRFDRAGVKIGYVKKIVTVRHAQRCTFVNSARCSV